MRIAISGTHLSGKSALLRALQKELPKFEVFDEPYWMLSELGREFSDPPTIEEFEEQLDYSIELIEQSPVNALFDRCPIDFLGYSRVIAEETSDEFDQEVWEAKIGEALTYLDLIVFLPIETPDLIALPESEDKYFRIQVD
jgi:predicted ATPase